MHDAAGRNIPEFVLNAPDGTPWNQGSTGAFVSITPADATVLSGIRGIYVGGAGILQAKNASGTVVPFTCTAGTKLPISPIAIMTATTATLIVALMS